MAGIPFPCCQRSGGSFVALLNLNAIYPNKNTLSHNCSSTLIAPKLMYSARFVRVIFCKESTTKLSPPERRQRRKAVPYIDPRPTACTIAARYRQPCRRANYGIQSPRRDHQMRKLGCLAETEANSFTQTTCKVKDYAGLEWR